MAKASFIVTDMDFVPLHDDDNGEPREFNTEAQALKAATEALACACGEDTEFWVWRLSHILSKPSMEPVIEKVRGS